LPLPARLIRLFKQLLWLALACLLTLFAVRGCDAARKPPLQPWHVYVPPELSAEEIDRADWNDYLQAEESAIRAARTYIAAHIGEGQRTPANRYYPDSPLHPEHFATDWNRSYLLMPPGEPVGTVVLLHGLTDSPYSLRHLARHYQQRGYVAVGIRLPGHGTVPGALAEIEWQQWMAATRLAAREAVRLGGGKPLHLVGYSNGAALALKYAFDSLADATLTPPQRIVLISPMIGVAAYARFAGLAGLPAILPPFAKAAWLDVLPEINPFKYNSFPLNAARQAYQLSAALQKRVSEQTRKAEMARFPPVLTFQSLLDTTVSTGAVVAALYDYLPANGSELVVFDLNRSAYLGPLLNPRAAGALEPLFPPGARNYRLTVVTNASPHDNDMIAHTVEAGEDIARQNPLAARYPRDVYSLSHIALPFPPHDSLYGSAPDESEYYGIHLGTLALRGERDALLMRHDDLARIKSNPFFPYLIERVDAHIDSVSLPFPTP